MGKTAFIEVTKSNSFCTVEIVLRVAAVAFVRRNWPRLQCFLRLEVSLRLLLVESSQEAEL